MNNDENFSGKTESAKKRIAGALAEYALNWETLEGSMDKEDLTGFLTMWKEEFEAQENPAPKDRLLQLANLLSNLEIQQDMLRTRKGWKTLPQDADPEVKLPPELASIKDTIDTVKS